MEQSGLVLDNIFNPKAGSWINGKNMVIPKGTKSFMNEPGFTTHTDLPLPVYGRIATPTSTVLFLGNDAISEIGVYTNNVYTPKLRDPLLNFNSRYPITGTYTYNHLGQLIVCFVAGNLSPMIINLDDLPFKSLLTNDLALINKAEFTLIQLFPNIKNSLIDVTDVQVGGSLKTGVYYLLCAYGYEEGDTTSWFSISNPISIYEANTSNAFNEISGSVGGIITNKSIVVNILNVDNNFKYINIGVISKINNIVTGHKLDSIPIVNNTVSTVIASLEGASPINITELLVNNPVYTNFDSVTNHDGQLVAANVKGMPVIDMQPYVNKMQVEWYRDKQVSIDGYKGSYKDPVYISKFKGFRAGEVYGFLAGYKLKQGGYYGIFPIPGRPPISGDRDIIDIGSYPNDSLLDTLVYKYQVRSTATDGGTGKRGLMGYWENRNEVYPQTFPVDIDDNPLANQPVRHHKFPTVSQLNDWGNPFLSTTKNTASLETTTLNDVRNTGGDIIDFIKLTHNDVVTPANSIISQYGSRYTALNDHKLTVTLDLNSIAEIEFTSIAHVINISLYTNIGILKTVVYEGTIDGTSNLHTVLNKVVNIKQNEYIVVTTFLNDISYITLDYALTYAVNPASYELDGSSFVEPLGIIISNINIPDEIKPFIEGIEIFYYERSANNISVLDQSILYPTLWDSDSNVGVASRFHGFDINTSLGSLRPTHVLTELIYELNEGTSTVRTANYITSLLSLASAFQSAGNHNDCRLVQNSAFHPANNSATVPSNITKENTFHITLNLGITLATNRRVLVNLCIYKTDMYNSMFNQRIVSTGQVIQLTDIVNANSEYVIFGGDTFISPFGFMLWKSLTPSNPDTPIAQYLRLLVHLPVESTANIGLRHETLELHEKFYPKTNIAAINVFETALFYQYGNYYGYNGDYSSINNLKSLPIFNLDTYTTDKFQHRIIRSLPQSRENTSLKWRIFPTTLYYDLPANKGEITGLVSFGKLLFILTKYTLYKAALKDLLQLFNTNAYLAQGDIFDRSPDEVYPTDNGFIGYQSKYAAVTTEFGLLIVDRFRGKVFLVAEDVKELTTPDVEVKIKDYLTLSTSEYIDFPLLANDSTYLAAALNTPLIYQDPVKLQQILDSIDNPIIDKGILLTYDTFYKRAILTINNIIKYNGLVDEEIGTVKPAYTILTVTRDAVTSDADKTFSFSLAGTTLTLHSKLFKVNANEFAINFRVTQATNIYNTLVALMAVEGLDDFFTVTQSGSSIYILATDTDVNTTIEDFTSGITSIVMNTNVPRRTEVDKSISLSIKLDAMFWLFKHDYIPTFGYNNVKDTQLIKNNLLNASVYTMNDRNSFGRYFTNNVEQSFIDVPINLKGIHANVFVDNVSILSTVRDIIKNNNLYSKTITHFAIYTQNQCTGLLPTILLGYINPTSNGHIFNEALVLFKFRDAVIDHNEPFITTEGEFLPINLADQVVTSVIGGRQYKITGVIDPNNDYLVYKTIAHRFNEEIITIDIDDTDIEINGNLVLKTYKSWENYSYIAAQMVVIRLVYDNVEQHLFELNNVIVNDNKNRKQ